MCIELIGHHSTLLAGCLIVVGKKLTKILLFCLKTLHLLVEPLHWHPCCVAGLALVKLMRWLCFCFFFSHRAKVGLNATLLLRIRVQKYHCCPPASEYSKCTNHSVDYHGFLAGERSRSTSHLHILPAFWLVLILNTAQNPVFTV